MASSEKGPEYLPYDQRTQPPLVIDDYPRTKLRTPVRPLVRRPLTLSERTGPTGLEKKLPMGPADMSRAVPGAPPAMGQHIEVTGQVLDEDDAPVPGAVLELWQANTSGRYEHEFDLNDAPIDPNFRGATRLLADANGRFSFRTIKPGAYPVASSTWEWRALHIHASIFGGSWMNRLITQAFFPGDPLIAQDLLLNSIPSPQARERLIMRMRPTVVRPHGNMLEFEHRFVLRGRSGTPTLIDGDEAPPAKSGRSFSQMTTGPFFPPHFLEPSLAHIGEYADRKASGQRIILTGRILDLNLEPTVNSVIEAWHADAQGVLRHPLDPGYARVDPGFCGWGRANTDKQGWYRFTTVLPGRQRSDDGTPRLPHVNALILASGIMRPLLTTVFFGDPGEPASDPVLGAVDPAHRAKLFAVRDPSRDEGDAQAYRFDIVLRGDTELPFFED